jgi:acyl-CoA thioesterase YciA
MPDQPRGKLTTRTMTMPADANPSGDIFGGWVLSQMDIAGGICARERARCRVVTVALDGMHFIGPVKIGDILAVYTEVTGVGNTSMEIHVEAWVQRGLTHRTVKVTQANFTFVALDEDGRPKPVAGENSE